MKKKKPSSLTTLVRHRIRRLRDSSGLTQAKLCELAGIASDSVSRFESGVRIPRLDTLEKLARVFDIDVATLVSDDKVPEPTTFPPSIMRIVHLLLLYPPSVHKACESLLKSALDGFLSVENARVLLKDVEKKKRKTAVRARNGKSS